jgi:precorrin-8X/cobalt-precorrin-8 methylmutase
MLIHHLLAHPLSGEAIEDRSMAIIDELCPDHGFGPEEWLVAKRLVHTTGDPTIIRDLRFSPDWCSAGATGLRAGGAVTTDSSMIRSGLSLARLRAINPSYGPEHLHCAVADPAVAAAAKAHGQPRSLFATRVLKPHLNGAICCFGNAPVGLMELSRLIVEEGIHPALVIAMPVGFVHVVESKDELMTLGIPFIALAGRRGGSPLAVAAVHALCLAAGRTN